MDEGYSRCVLSPKWGVGRNRLPPARGPRWGQVGPSTISARCPVYLASRPPRVIAVRLKSTNWRHLRCVGASQVRRRKLLCLDARRLDDRPPFLDLGLVEGSQPLRHLLVAWHNLITQVYKPLAGTLNVAGPSGKVVASSTWPTFHLGRTTRSTRRAKLGHWPRYSITSSAIC